MPESQQILMPKLGLTMTEGVLAEWRVAPGDSVKAGDVIFLVETDKISNEIEAVADAIVESLHVDAGDLVPVGQVIATFCTDGEASFPPSSPSTKLMPPKDAPRTKRTIATPLARRLASDAGLDIASIIGTGPRGRIMADDVTSMIEAKPAALPPPSPFPAAALAGDLRPLGRYQQVTARRLTEAKRDIPHFYVMTEADVSELLDLRQRLNADASFTKLTINHFVIASVARALASMPEVNSVWTDDGIVQLHEIAIGLAVESPLGLVAPVLHDLAGLPLDDVAATASALVDRARTGRLNEADLRGGALSISNVGMFGVTGLIPIINPGQSAILGLGHNTGRFLPDVKGQPVLRQIVHLALSCDHRVIDGALAARFLSAVQSSLEEPHSLLRRQPKGPSA